MGRMGVCDPMVSRSISGCSSGGDRGLELWALGDVLRSDSLLVVVVVVVVSMEMVLGAPRPDMPMPRSVSMSVPSTEPE